MANHQHDFDPRPRDRWGRFLPGPFAPAGLTAYQDDEDVDDEDSDFEDDEDIDDEDSEDLEDEDSEDDDPRDRHGWR